MPNYSTPGVYVEEISTFPATIVRVATAVPVFVGYTEFSGSEVNNIPTKVQSLVEYERLFGGEPTTDGRSITVTLDASGAATNVELALDFYLYHSLRHYYANGGGDAYILSVGEYDVPSAPVKSVLISALDLLEHVDEPTLVLVPDAFALSASDMGEVQDAVLGHCAKMQDRFGIFDVQQLPGGNGSIDDADQFRDEIGSQNLKYGAAYYPELLSSLGPTGTIDGDSFQLSGPIDLVTAAENAEDPALLDYAGSLADTATLQADITIGGDDQSFEDWIAQLQTVIDDVTADIDTIPTTLPTDAKDFLKDEFIAIFEGLTKWLYDFHGSDFVINSLDAQRDSDLDAVAGGLKAIVQKLCRIDISYADLATVLGSGTFTELGVFPALPGSVYNVTYPLPPRDFDYTLATIVADATVDYSGVDEQAAVASVILGLQPQLTALLGIYNSWLAELTGRTFEPLLEGSSVIANIVKAIRETGYTLPPSGAVAGVYANTDASRGVWKAPANVSLNAVREVRKLSGDELDDLNISAGTGKSINAIRLFRGQGILVYGARTLAGNDNEWRYVPVRRLFNMVEESVRKALEPMVFEPNDGNTWVKVRGMVESFLLGIWRDGGLAGGSPEDAFFVKVGLGQTMSAQDILEGKLIVEIGMAAVRPAEFVILKFSHMMQTS